MPEKYDPEQVERLIGSVDVNTKTMELLREEVDDARDTSRDAKKSSEDSKHVAKMVGSLVVVMVVAMVVFGVYVVQTKRSLDRANQVRAERTAAACAYDNVKTSRIRQALVLSLSRLAADPDHLTDNEKVILARYAETVAAQLPYRSCTPDGIKVYYDNPPEDPNRGGN